MAIALINQKLPVMLASGVMVGPFTGNYTPRGQMVLLENAALVFSQEVKNVKKLNEVKSNELAVVKTKLMGMGLPFTAALAEEVGFYGLRWGRLDLCQYYKKTMGY